MVPVCGANRTMTTKLRLLVMPLLAVSACTHAESYEDFIGSMLAERDSIRAVYLKADSRHRSRIIIDARKLVFESIITRSFDFWSGTRWEFYGQTRTPKTGTIACGYFVTTVLYDIGFDLPRVAWAKSASEYFITRISRDIVRFHDRPVREVREYIERRPDGLYIVGLDCHVGFIYKYGRTVKFVHASYYHPETGVMAEDVDTGNPLGDSRYRVVGRILDDRMIRDWILGRRFD